MNELWLIGFFVSLFGTVAVIGLAIIGGIYCCHLIKIGYRQQQVIDKEAASVRAKLEEMVTR